MLIENKTVFLGRLYAESYDIYTVSTLCTSSLSWLGGNTWCENFHLLIFFYLLNDPECL